MMNQVWDQQNTFNTFNICELVLCGDLQTEFFFKNAMFSKRSVIG